MPVYYVLLLVLGGLIFVSPSLTFFEFAQAQEQKVVREMGFASITLWGFLVVLLTAPLIITAELEDRTALTLLSKPVSRASFLLGKFAGLVGALLMGVLFLSLVLLLTRWTSVGIRLLESPDSEAQFIELGWWGFLRDRFLVPEAKVIVGGSLLCLFQVAILAAFGLALATFLPVLVSLALVSLIFVLGNLSTTMISATTASGHPILVFLSLAIYHLFPNFGYLNLQDAFSEGRAIQAGYLVRAGGYTVLYCSCLLGIACEAFARREIR
jgi:ABC-type transport system involved in multi-copper enzyme maturation permease subunit